MRRSSRIREIPSKNLKEISSDDDEISESGEENEEEYKLQKKISSNKRTAKQKDRSPLKQRKLNESNIPPKQSTDSAAVSKRKATSSRSEGNIKRGQHVKSGASTNKPSPKSGEIFEALQKSNKAVSSIVKSWFAVYAKNPAKARSDFVNFLIHSCGSTIEVADVDEEDIGAILSEAQADVPVDTQGYPLVSRKHRSFPQRFADFWDELTAKVTRSSDDTLMNFCIEWLAALSNCKMGIFRHTAVSAAYQIVRSLIVECVELHNATHVNAKLIDKENKKQSPNSDKISQLEADDENHSSAIAWMEKLMLEGVFHGYRDTRENIRALSIESLGDWILEYPSLFLQDIYLKYFGWLLNDKNALVRFTAIDSIYNLLQREEFESRLSNFCRRFTPRILEMIQDLDANTSAKSIEVLTSLLRKGFLSEENSVGIPAYLTDGDPSVREAAAEFVYQDYFSSRDEDEQPEKFDELVQLLTVMEDQFGEELKADAAQNIADLFWDKLPCLQQWDVMIKYLLEAEKEVKATSKKTNSTPDDLRQNLLVHLILACVQRATGTLDISSVSEEESPKKQKGRHKKEVLDPVKERQNALTSYFISELPTIFTTFQADSVKLLPLVQLPKRLALEQYSLRNQQKYLDDLLHIIKVIYLKHNSPQLIQATADTLNALCFNEYQPQQGHSVIHQLASELIQHLLSLWEANGHDLNDQENEYAIGLCVKRILLLQQAVEHPISEFSLYDKKVKKLVDSIITNRLMSEPHDHNEVLVDLLMFYLTQILQNLGILDEADPKPESAPPIFADSVRQCYTHLFCALQRNQSISVVYQLAVDFCSNFSPKLSTTYLGELCDIVTPDFKTALTDTFNVIIHETLKSSNAKSKQSGLRSSTLRITARLVAYNLYDYMDLAASFTHYLLLVDSESENIIKKTLHRIKELGTPTNLQCQLLALQKANEGKHKSFEATKALADRLVLMHGLMTTKRSFLPFFKNAFKYVFHKVPERFQFLNSAVRPYLKRASQTDIKNAALLFEKAQAQLPEAKPKTNTSLWHQYADFDEYLQNLVKGKSVTDIGQPKHQSKPSSKKRRTAKLALSPASSS